MCILLEWNGGLFIRSVLIACLVVCMCLWIFQVRPWFAKVVGSSIIRYPEYVDVVDHVAVLED